MREQLPCALTIAGSDSGAGAGIQADLKTFAALGVHGTSAITCITAQNPSRVLGIQPCTTSMVRTQLESVFSELPPRAVKSGMLYSRSIIHTVAEYLRRHRTPLVVDPVMVSTSGARLLKTPGISTLCSELLPLATIMTPNLEETELLVAETVRSVQDMRRAAKNLHERFGCAVLVKGGHLRGLREAVDIFFDGSEELLLTAPFVPGVKTHGTGCTYSAAITAGLARDVSLSRAVEQAKQFISQAIAESRMVGRHHVLHWL
jgi:hydroxymethylpyrimidine kinase/phosphomethylpyrimidine kinase